MTSPALTIKPRSEMEAKADTIRRLATEARTMDVHLKIVRECLELAELSARALKDKFPIICEEAEDLEMLADHIGYGISDFLKSAEQSYADWCDRQNEPHYGGE